MRWQMGPPSAEIVLLDYPQLFDETSLTCVSGVGGAGMIRINAMARTMASAQQQMVTTLHSSGVPVSYESPDPDFAGRRACDDPEGIDKIVVVPPGER
ncbi:hypothetical protein ACF1GY_24110 [Streptomyces sp. NPDC014684]|uniref:hypothetical protein n=1 Tax=Streptomyces sp. NPDC014684 TaxID=3364880 RepID=UPI0036F8FC54